MRTALNLRDEALAYQRAKLAIAACQRLFSRVSQHQSVDDDEIIGEITTKATGADLTKGDISPCLSLLLYLLNGSCNPH